MAMEANPLEEEEVLEQPEVMFQQMEQAQKVVMGFLMTLAVLQHFTLAAAAEVEELEPQPEELEEVDREEQAKLEDHLAKQILAEVLVEPHPLTRVRFLVV
jgi:hypothetical protein